MIPSIAACFILGFFFLADMVLTYAHIGKIIQKYPKLDYKYFEYNPFIKWAWDKFGFEGGTFIAPIFLCPFWFFAIYVTLTIPQFVMVFAGMYSMVFLIHIANLNEDYSSKKTLLSEFYEKIYGGKPQ
jgi:hypothetical protein